MELAKKVKAQALKNVRASSAIFEKDRQAEYERVVAQGEARHRQAADLKRADELRASEAEYYKKEKYVPSQKEVVAQEALKRGLATIEDKLVYLQPAHQKGVARLTDSISNAVTPTEAVDFLKTSREEYDATKKQTPIPAAMKGILMDYARRELVNAYGADATYTDAKELLDTFPQFHGRARNAIAREITRAIIPVPGRMPTPKKRGRPRKDGT